MKVIFRVVAVVVILACACGAQNTDALKESPTFYKLDFVVKDMEGSRVVTSRSYSMMVASERSAEIRAGSKVYIISQYYDLGTNIDCTPHKDVHGDLSLYLKVEVTSLLQDTTPQPVVRENKWSSQVVVPLKKPTIVFSSDDNTTKHVLQFEITATPQADSR